MHVAELQFCCCMACLNLHIARSCQTFWGKWRTGGVIADCIASMCITAKLAAILGSLQSQSRAWPECSRLGVHAGLYMILINWILVTIMGQGHVL